MINFAELTKNDKGQKLGEKGYLIPKWSNFFGNVYLKEGLVIIVSKLYAFLISVSRKIPELNYYSSKNYNSLILTFIQFL